MDLKEYLLTLERLYQKKAEKCPDTLNGSFLAFIKVITSDAYQVGYEAGISRAELAIKEIKRFGGIKSGMDRYKQKLDEEQRNDK